MQEHRSILHIVLYLSEEIYIGYFCYVLPLSLAASDGFMVYARNHTAMNNILQVHQLTWKLMGSWHQPMSPGSDKRKYHERKQ
jgi:hypothetical protein